MFERETKLQGYPDHWVASDTYTPMANGPELLSNGYGLYKTRLVPTQHLCKPDPAVRIGRLDKYLLLWFLA